MDQESEERIIRERKQKLLKFLKESNIWVIVFLIIALILGIYIRILPMVDHSRGIPSFLEFIFNPFKIFEGKPGLWDITKNEWALGPDLDPWLFLRDAKIISEKGFLPKIDYMRNVPLGFDNTIETQLLPYLIFWLYKFLKFFDGGVSVEFAGVFFPVVMFFLTIISFFLFVREIFFGEDKESKIKANVIALISAFLMIVTPVFLSRTVAGIPEKESAAFFFIFLSFYFFLKSWKSKDIKRSVIFSLAAGISTSLTGLIWGGVFYIFIPIGLAVFVSFLVNKTGKKEILIYFLWFFLSSFLLVLFSNKYPLINIFTSLDTGFCFSVLLIMVFHFVFCNTKLSNIKNIENLKLSKNLLSIIITFLFLILLSSLLLGPGFLIEKIKLIHSSLFTPISGRWNVTVAENRQPYFLEWVQSFGPFLKNIPILFWLFFIGSVVFFKKTFNKIEKKDSWILTLLYLIFLSGLIFSRYAPHPHVFDGEGFISKISYYGSALLLFGFFVLLYERYYRKEDKSFEKIEFENLLLLSFFVFVLITVRGAIRLTMVLTPLSSIFTSFLIVELVYQTKKTKDENYRVFLLIASIIVIAAGAYVFYNFYNEIRIDSYNYIPSYYNIQWQKAMEWVRNETPQGSVFAHWWDYGYWLQSIGERPTVVDGGNAIVYWNYLMGRLVLTGDNQKDSLDFLYSHNASYLLIDSSDIGKYGAFSSIGSDKNYDRYSWIGTFVLDERQTQENQNQTVYVYTGGIALDEDLSYVNEESGKKIFLPSQKTAIVAVLIPIEQTKNNSMIHQPSVIMIYQGVQHKIPVRYLYINDEFIDFKSGIKATPFVFPLITEKNGRVMENKIGAVMFLTPRLMRGFFAQKYILNDPFNNFPNFKLVHVEDNLIVNSLRNQGMSLPDFIYFQGVQGPIKIWKINYTGNEKIKQEYLDRDPYKYIDWKL